MEHPKAVIKSKSSNTAITSKYPAKTHAHQATKPASKSGNKNKKSWSSAEFHGTTSKKRGVYVEKKSANVLNTRQAVGTVEDQRLQRATRKDRKHSEKEFLNSIQNILSKETASTQYPEVHDELKPGKPRKILRRVGVETTDKGTQDLDAIYRSQNNSPIRHRSPVRARSPGPKVIRPKYRSRVLNENAKLEEKLIVLEPMRKLETTPSVHSVKTSAADSKTASQTQPAAAQGNVATEAPVAPVPEAVPAPVLDVPKILDVTDDTLTQNSNQKTEIGLDNIASTIHASESDLNGKQLKKAKVLRIEEPATLVSEYKPKEKSLYNFFVDLLETTFSVYNIHTEFNADKSIESKSNEMVIDHTIVKRLNMPEKPKNNELFSDSNFKRTNRNTMAGIDEVLTDNIEVYKFKPNCSNMNPPILKLPRNRSASFRNNLHSKSHSYNLLYQRNYRSDSPKNESVDVPRKPLKARSKKRTLLNLLKEELQMDDDAFEEPQTFHQALKIIAKNKRRCRRYIHFEDQPKKRSPNAPDCMFKRRKIISSSTKSTRKNKNFRIFNPQTTFMDSIKTSALPRKFSGASLTTNPNEYQLDERDIASYHSIEVSAFAYEPDQMLRCSDNKNKTILYAFHSVESIVTESLSSKDFLGNKKKDYSTGGSSTSIDQLLADYDYT